VKNITSPALMLPCNKILKFPDPPPQELHFISKRNTNLGNKLAVKTQNRSFTTTHHLGSAGSRFVEWSQVAPN